MKNVTFLTNRLVALSNEINNLADQLKEIASVDNRKLLNKEELADRYGVSKSYIDKLMLMCVFVEEKHYSRPFTNAHPLFHIDECDKVMFPRLVAESTSEKVY